MNSKQAKITSRNCKQQLQARSEFKTRQIMKLPNQKVKVPFFLFLLFFFDRNQPMTQPSAGKNAIKRVPPWKFLCQIIFCNAEFAQNYRKIEFHGKKIEFQGKKSSFGLLGKIEFPSKRTKKKPVNNLL